MTQHRTLCPACGQTVPLKLDARGFEIRMKRHGEQNGAAKLTAARVEEIRDDLSQGRSGAAIARQYGVSPTTIYNIKHGRLWVVIG